MRVLTWEFICSPMDGSSIKPSALPSRRLFSLNACLLPTGMPSSGFSLASALPSRLPSSPSTYSLASALPSCSASTVAKQVAEEDLLTCIALGRPSTLKCPALSILAHGGDDLGEDFPFVHDLVKAMLFSHIGDTRKLKRLLQQDWVPEWKAWENTSTFFR